MTNRLFGKRVRIKGITHDTDRDLNGMTGTLRPKFFEERGFLIFGDVGVWLDEPIEGAFVINILWDEYEVISPRNTAPRVLSEENNVNSDRIPLGV